MKATRHQIIWHRKKNADGSINEDADMELKIPKIINSDIGFQLMFGPNEDIRYDRKKTNDHHKKQSTHTKTIDNTKDPFKWI